MTNIDILELDRLPEHLIVIGGGYVGLEFAQAYRRFGSRVTILQRAAHLLGSEDPDISNELERILVAEGIEVLTRAEVVQVTGRSEAEVSVVVRAPEGERVVTGTGIDIGQKVVDAHGNQSIVCDLPEPRSRFAFDPPA
jgi:pyruvate/2-oxoglutarate dehydrogenase complex dihydrolipoamide dehydrogenase (E3) component